MRLSADHPQKLAIRTTSLTLLIEFSVENFRSFRDRSTLSLEAAAIRSPGRVDADTVTTTPSGLRLLRSAAIYGPNAGGKSNLVKAIQFMREKVLHSTRLEWAEAGSSQPFLLDTTTRSQPSGFEVVFLLGGVTYRYGFELLGVTVSREWLFCIPTSREAMLFERTRSSIRLGERFRKARSLAERTRQDALFLSVAAQFNVGLALALSQWFERLGHSFSVNAGERVTAEQLEDPSRYRAILRLLQSCDTSVADLAAEWAPPPGLALDDPIRAAMSRDGSPRTQMHLQSVMTTHPIRDERGCEVAREQFDLSVHESDGTRKLFAIAGPLLLTLETGSVWIIDELDAGLHPTLTAALITLFHSDESNPHGAQLIFTTHDTHLLSPRTFRRDQVWFVEKDALERSQLVSLVEYRVRNDAAFGAEYLRGGFGALPSIDWLPEAVARPADVESGM